MGNHGRKELDELEIGILRALLVNNGVPPGTPALRKSYRSLAKELRVDEGTIRNRMKKLQSRRILRGWYLGRSPAATGAGMVYAWFSVKPDSKHRVIEELLASPSVERVCDYVGARLSVVIAVEKGTDPSATLEKAALAAGPDAHLAGSTMINAVPTVIGETDLAIVAVLRRDPWTPFSSIARELRISERTVRRRVSKLAENGIAYMLPVIDLKALQGVIPAELVVDYGSDEGRSAANRRLYAKLGEDLIFSGPSGRVGYFAFIVRNVSAVERIAKWANDQPGVKHVSASVLQDVILNPRYYDAGRESERLTALTRE